MGELDVSPHPAGEADESAVLAPNAMLADEAVKFGGVRPISLDSQDAEAMALHQAMGDRRARAIEFRRSMRRFAQQHDFGVRENVKMSREIGRMQVRQRLRFGAHSLGEIADRWRQSKGHDAPLRFIGALVRIRRPSGRPAPEPAG